MRDRIDFFVNNMPQRDGINIYLRRNGALGAQL